MSVYSSPSVVWSPKGERVNDMMKARLEAEAERLLRALDALGPTLFDEAQRLCAAGHGRTVTYSPKVFIPVTRLCRDVCTYCTFVRQPRQVPSPYLSPDELLALCRQAKAAGCTEALFTLGDKPELRYAAARRALDELGYASTVDYVAALCATVLAETGLLPHVNAGVMDEADLLKLRTVSASQGLMLEQASPALMERGGPHYGSPDKDPALRMAMIEAAGRLAIPFTSGILIGIGESRRDRLVSLLMLRETHERYGHIQEIIVQNFRAKPDTRMAAAAEPDLDDLMWTAAAARLVLGPAMNIQVPPNLSYADFPRLLKAGINDWGGVSPVTPDHVNPEAPWPEIATLERRIRGGGSHAGAASAGLSGVHARRAAMARRGRAPGRVPPRRQRRLRPRGRLVARPDGRGASLA